MSELPSNAGYADEVDDIFIRYEARDPAAIHAPWSQYFPEPPAKVLDIGSGTGRDAGWFASLGHLVVAAEPTEALRTRAAKLHISPNITWLDDILPGIPNLLARNESFDLILMHAVWMHLTETDRTEGMANVARLMRPGARLAMSLRHGPIPEGRRMFEVTGEETIKLALENGLTNLKYGRAESISAENRARGIEWTKLVFEKS